MNKIIKMTILVVCTAAMAFIIGCGGGGGTPDSIANDVIKCLKSADIDGISKYSTGDFKQGMKMLKGMMEGAGKNGVAEFKKDFNNKKYEIGAAVIDGDKATVPVKIDGKDAPIKFVKVDGAWKVDDFNFKNM